MNSSYGILFGITLQHEYFLNRTCNDFEIVPATDCLAIFKKLKIQWKYTENRYFAFIEENSRHEPYLNIPPDKNYRNDYGKAVFRFYLRLKNPLFLNYTNIDPAYGNRKKFYFSNTANNKDNETLYLSSPVAPFANERQYIPGSLARDARSGKVYEALRKHTGKKKPEIADTDLWAPKDLLNTGSLVTDHTPGKTYSPGDLVTRPATGNLFEAVRKHTAGSDEELEDALLWTDRGKGNLQYPTDNDIIPYTTGSYTFLLSEPVKKAQVTILRFNYNAAAPAYDQPVRESEMRLFDRPAAEVPVDLSSLQPGKYAIKVNKETTVIYYDPAFNYSTTFGVIEIFNHLPGDDEYALLTGDEQLKGVNYQLLFPVRRVLWKYIRKDGKAQRITDIGETGYQFNRNGDAFVSSTPIPLSEGALKTLKLEFSTADFAMFPLPNPPVENLRKCTQHEYDYFCSELNLNY